MVSVNRNTGIERCLTGSGWAAKILEPKLAEAVPEEVHRLFEVARGSMVYGWFYYPLYTLGSQHLYFVHEAATTHKCKLANAPPMKNFSRQIEWLAKHGYIREERIGQWDAVRALRNGFAHAERQAIYTPGMAISDVWIATELINELFCGEQAQMAK